MPLVSLISRFPQRWLMCLLCSLSLAGTSFRDICFFENYNIVKTFTQSTITFTSTGCPKFYSGCHWEKKEIPFYLPSVYWTPSVLDMAYSAYWIGRCVIAVPAGLLSDVGYSRYVLGGGMFLVTITTTLLPTTAELGTAVFLMTRMVEGIGDGTILPSVISLISRWTSPSKRNTFTVLVVAGFYYGNTFGHLFFYLTYSFYSSWSFRKYTSGFFGIVWLILWFIFGYHSPALSPFVIADDVANTTHQGSPLKGGLKRLRKVQWKEIIHSRPFLSAVLLFCSQQWIVKANIDDILETYQSHILHLPDRFSESSSIVAITALPSSVMGGLLSDWVIKRELISGTNIKKILVFKSILLSSLFIVLTTFVGCNYILFWILACTAVYVVGLADSAVFTSPIDLSPRNAGLLTGIMVVGWTLLSLIDHNTGALVTLDPLYPSFWQLTATLNVIAAFVLIIPFLVYGSAEKQRWDRRVRLFVTNVQTRHSTSE